MPCRHHAAQRAAASVSLIWSLQTIKHLHRIGCECEGDLAQTFLAGVVRRVVPQMQTPQRGIAVPHAWPTDRQAVLDNAVNAVRDRSLAQLTDWLHPVHLRPNHRAAVMAASTDTRYDGT